MFFSSYNPPHPKNTYEGTDRHVTGVFQRPGLLWGMYVRTYVHTYLTSLAHAAIQIGRTQTVLQWATVSDFQNDLA